MTSRTSTEVYGQAGKTIAQIGNELNVDFIVEGSVMKAGHQVRVVLQLIEVRSDEPSGCEPAIDRRCTSSQAIEVETSN